MDWSPTYAGGKFNAIISDCFKFYENTILLLLLQLLIYPFQLQERFGASSAIIEDGAALWVLGGYNKDVKVDTKTMIFKNNMWQWGPDLTSTREEACSVTMGNGDVIISGDSYGDDNDSEDDDSENDDCEDDEDDDNDDEFA